MGKRLAVSGFARLPVELVNIIFGLAAESSRHTCLDLCLVASWARQIALPYLFRTLVAKDHGAKFNIYLANRACIPINTNINPASLVKHVWMPLETDDTTNPVLDVFENCHNIVHIALTIYCFCTLIRATSPPLIADMRKTISGPALDRDRDLHLTLLSTTFFNWTFPQYWQPNVMRRSPLYDQITHIRVETVNSFHVYHLFKLDHFSRLSHLSVPYYHPTQHVAEQLDDLLELQSLEMFVVAGVRKPLQQAHWKRLQEWVWAKRRSDKRVFFVEVPAMDIQAEWEAEMRGGESLWDRALRYTTQWEAREEAEAALVRIFDRPRIVNCTDLFVAVHQELQAANSQTIMPRRSRRNAL
jgi:hypothetical protein